MDNYKIKVKDEAESKEAQELFEQLGYSNGQSKRFGFVYTQNGEIGCDSMEHWDYYNDLCQELTLPKLRDLVVLKRNDVKDANCIDKKREAWYLASDGTYYAWQYRKLCWDTESDACVEAHDIKPIIKHLETATGRFDENGEHHLTFSKGTEEKGPALISGADVPALIKKGESVQFRSAFNVQGGGEWKDLDLERDEEEFSLGDLINTRFEWRLKPQTIKLELELPKPFEPKVGDLYWCVAMTNLRGYTQKVYKDDGDDECLIHLGAYRTEEEIKQVVEQLRKIRGTNS